MHADTIQSTRSAILNRLEMAKLCRILGKDPWVIEANDAYRGARQPCVSVIITLFNYSEYIEECLDSVCASKTDELPSEFEILIVDDCSTDRSAFIAEKYLHNHPQIPIALVKKQFNTGLADARNVGLHVARAPYAFILDADNWIYPNCLSVLYRAIHESNYAAVYGTINKFDNLTREGAGLVSCYEWDARELIRGPYIDAMAMVDREIVLSVGGYSTELLQLGWFGWEDYDLWLKLAEAHQSCKLVPQILSAYRVHVTSMLNTTNQYTLTLAKYFLRKFSGLLREYDDLDRFFGFARQTLQQPQPQAPSSPPTEQVNAIAPQMEQLNAELQQARERIAAMETSKFWQLRKRWFRIKRALGLPDNE